MADNIKEELLAPRYVEFYSADWSPIGDRDIRGKEIGQFTGINEEALKNIANFECIAAIKMSWAARRETSRGEDMAYCLLGLFGVSMPLLYGEGKEKAFTRLQEEILKFHEDHSLFMWAFSSAQPLERPAPGSLLSTGPELFVGFDRVPSIGNFSPRNRNSWSRVLGLPGRREWPGTSYSVYSLLHQEDYALLVNRKNTNQDEIYLGTSISLTSRGSRMHVWLVNISQPKLQSEFRGEPDTTHIAILNIHRGHAYVGIPLTQKAVKNAFHRSNSNFCMLDMEFITQFPNAIEYLEIYISHGGRRTDGTDSPFVHVYENFLQIQVEATPYRVAEGLRADGVPTWGWFRGGEEEVKFYFQGYRSFKFPGLNRSGGRGNLEEFLLILRCSLENKGFDDIHLILRHTGNPAGPIEISCSFQEPSPEKFISKAWLGGKEETKKESVREFGRSFILVTSSGKRIQVGIKNLGSALEKQTEFVRYYTPRCRLFIRSMDCDWQNNEADAACSSYAWSFSEFWQGIGT